MLSELMRAMRSVGAPSADDQTQSTGLIRYCLSQRNCLRTSPRLPHATFFTPFPHKELCFARIEF
jgi:hypothetical protein